MTNHVPYEKSLSDLAAELKDELKEFLQTRYQMLASEMREKVSILKTSLPMIMVGLVFLFTAWLLLTAALVGGIAMAFLPNPYAYPLALLIVGVFYLIVGAAAAVFAYSHIREQGFAPKRTMRVLKEDQAWFQAEARSQL